MANYYDPVTWTDIDPNSNFYDFGSGIDPSTGDVGSYGAGMHYYQNGDWRQAVQGDRSDDAYYSKWNNYGNFGADFGDQLKQIAQANGLSAQDLQTNFNNFMRSRGLDPYSNSNQTGMGVASGWWGPQTGLRGFLYGNDALTNKYINSNLEAYQQKGLAESGTRNQNNTGGDWDDLGQILGGLGFVFGAGLGANSLWGVDGLGGGAGAMSGGGGGFGSDAGGFLGSDSGAGWIPDEWTGQGLNGGVNTIGSTGAANPFEAIENGLANPSGAGVTSAGGPMANGWQGNLANGTLSQNLGSLMGSSGSGTGINTPFGNIGLKDLISTGFNLLNNNRLSGNLQDAANRSASLNDPSQRPGAQQAYSTFMDYVNNPQKYYQNQGAATSNAIMQGVPAAIAKSGNWGNVVSNAGTSIAGALSGQYNGFLSNLAGLTGLNQGTGGAGTVYGQLAGASAGADSAGYAGLGSLLGKSLPDLLKGFTTPSPSSGAVNSNTPFGTSFA